MWKPEALFQEQMWHPIGHVDIPDDQNTTVTYGAALVKGAAHRKAGQQWLDFIVSSQGLNNFERYGFKPLKTQGN